MGTRPEIPLSRGGGALGCRTCGTGSHVRHGIGTCGPTGAKLPSQGLLEGPGQKSPSHKALEHWDAARAARDWHVRTHRCQSAQTRGTGPEIPLSQGAGALGCPRAKPACQTTRERGENARFQFLALARVARFGTGPIGTGWL
jgi:hypothetical protein